MHLSSKSKNLLSGMFNEIFNKFFGLIKTKDICKSKFCGLVHDTIIILIIIMIIMGTTVIIIIGI